LYNTEHGGDFDDDVGIEIVTKIARRKARPWKSEIWGQSDRKSDDIGKPNDGEEKKKSCWNRWWMNAGTTVLESAHPTSLPAQTFRGKPHLLRKRGDRTLGGDLTEFT